MALSGSFTGSTANQYILPKITWSAKQNIAGNYSDVTATLHYSRTNTGFTTEGNWSGSITINGTVTTGSKHIVITYNSNTVAMSATVRVYHNADGKKSITISCTGSAPPSTLTSTSCSATVTLDTIPRTSTVTATDANIGSKTTIAISRASSGFTHTLTYAFGDLTGTIATKTASTSISWTVPTGFYAEIPNDPSGKCTITCVTYSGSTKIGEDTAEFTATADKSVCEPTVSVVAIDTNEDVIALTGSNKVIVKGFSDVEVTTTAEAQNSASLSASAVSVSCGSAKKTGTKVTFDNAENATIKATVTDSRGYSNDDTASGLTLVNYIVPTIVETISRESPTSDIVNISVTGKWFNGSFGSVKNSLRVQVRYKPKSRSSYEDADKYVDMTVSVSGNTYTASVSLSDLVYTQAYSIRIRVSDAIHVYEGPLADPIYRNTEISKGVPVFDWGEDDFKFNVPVGLDSGAFAAGAFKTGVKLWYGTVTIMPTAADTVTSGEIEFPAGLFSATPCVCVTPSSSVPDRVSCSCVPTASGVTVYMSRTNTTETRFYVIAIGI